MGVRVLAFATAVAMAGCGLTMTTGPGRVVPGQRPVCTESMRAPTLDAAPAGIGLLTVLVGALFLEADDNDSVGAPLIIGGGALTVVSYISGGIGYYRVKHCREAIARFDRSRPPSWPSSASPPAPPPR
jgi:hypothetical protein